MTLAILHGIMSHPTRDFRVLYPDTGYSMWHNAWHVRR